MVRGKLKHKVTGEIIECFAGFDKSGVHKYCDPIDNNKVYSLTEYDYIPLTPYELFGVECMKGWKSLYEPILQYVEEYNKDKDDEHKIVIRQLKEKWARLSFSFNFKTEELKNMVSKAISDSKNVCEDCGSRSDIGEVICGWHHIICFDCLLDELKKRETHHKLPRKLKKAYKNKKRWATIKVSDENRSYWMCNKDGNVYVVYPNGYKEISKNSPKSIW